MKKNSVKNTALFNSSKSKSQLLQVAIAVLVGVTVFSGFYLKQINSIKPQSIGINEVKEMPLPMPPEKACSTVSAISYTGACATGKLSKVTFFCSGSKQNYQLGETNSCKTVSEWYNEALKICEKSCKVNSGRQTPVVSPFPKTSVLPKASLLPVPVTSPKTNPMYGTDPVKNN